MKWLCVLLMTFALHEICMGQGTRGELASEPLVDIAKADPSIIIDLRYGTERNITKRAIYPPGTPCLLRRAVAEQLKLAQYHLRGQGYGLKIWDAYRPAYAQLILWDLVKNPEVVADPSKGGSVHTWGAAVDVTLVDQDGKDVPMPTDFDDFTAAAKAVYAGTDPIVARNLHILQSAMVLAGFYGMRDEWWHFMAKNWQSYKAVTDPVASPPPSVAPGASVSPMPLASPLPLASPVPEATAVPTPQMQGGH